MVEFVTVRFFARRWEIAICYYAATASNKAPLEHRSCALKGDVHDCPDYDAGRKASMSGTASLLPRPDHRAEVHQPRKLLIIAEYRLINNSERLYCSRQKA